MSGDVGPVVGRAAGDEIPARLPVRPPPSLRPVSHPRPRSLGRVCPLYIGATAWPSQEDEERVDAAYNQEFPPVGRDKPKVNGLTLEEIERRKRLAKLIQQMQQEKEAIAKALAKAEKKAHSLQEQVSESLRRIDAGRWRRARESSHQWCERWIERLEYTADTTCLGLPYCTGLPIRSPHMCWSLAAVQN
ncbi:unnamed protein product [Durusdinium trenchii]|uniref:RAB6-interacting golgin n=1 Tax=Durusdinium trenchii TaxID=1381693 RepID=A0ABP0HKB5_9DINO